MNGLELDARLSPELRVRRWHLLGRDRPRYPESAHDALELAWVEKGLCRYRIGRRWLDVGPGDAIVVPEGVGHQTEIEPGTRARSVWLGPSVLQGVTEVTGRALPSAGLVDDDRITAAASVLFALGSRPDPMLVELAVEALALRLISGARGASAGVDPRIRRALELIETSFAEPLSIDALARTARMSRYHFSRVFRSQTGKSPYRFLQETRVARAAALLQRGERNVTEAAYAVGFTDLGRFGRTFKGVMGCTPSAFARAHGSHKTPHEPHGGPKGRRLLIGPCESTLS